MLRMRSMLSERSSVLETNKNKPSAAKAVQILGRLRHD